MIACIHTSYKMFCTTIWGYTCHTCSYVLGETLLTCVIKWWYIVSILVGVKYVWMIWFLLSSDLHKIIQHWLIAHKPKSYICSNGCVIHHMLNRIPHDHMVVFTQCHSLVSRSIHFCRQSFILHWPICHVYKVFDNFTQIFIYKKFQMSINQKLLIWFLLTVQCLSLTQIDGHS